MRVLVTGQVGLDKKQYLEEVAALAAARGESGADGLRIYHIGDRMYREAGDVPPGRILDLPLSRLNSLRRAVFRDVLADLNGESAPRHAIVNTHATFRWKHGLFAAFDFDQLALFNADLYIVLVDNIETVHARLLRDHDLEHSLKDLMVWREEEILATEILAKAPLPAGISGTAHTPPRFLVLARGREGPRGSESTAETLFRLIFRPHMKKVYPSFPMSHVADLPETLAEINAFRAKIGEHFIAFDPGDVDEKLLAEAAIRAAQAGKGALTIPHPAPEARSQQKDDGGLKGEETLTMKLADLLAILPDIDGQIYARDFMLVRQAEMIISYIPELPGGKPGLSSGVERELQHAHDHGREVYVIWKPRKEPSPFITQTANRVFRSIEEAMLFFEGKGYLQKHSLFG